MSFEFSIGDAIAIAKLGLEVVFGAWKACGEQQELTIEVTSVHNLLNSLHCGIANPESLVSRLVEDEHRRRELACHIRGCWWISRVVDKVLVKYNSLAEDKKTGTLE